MIKETSNQGYVKHPLTTHPYRVQYLHQPPGRTYTWEIVALVETLQEAIEIIKKPFPAGVTQATVSKAKGVLPDNDATGWKWGPGAGWITCAERKRKQDVKIKRRV